MNSAVLCAVFLHFIPISASGNEGTFFPYPDAEIRNKYGDELRNPFAGGLTAPQFANYDLNGNGTEDLLVFDRVDNTLIPFLINEDPDNPVLTYAPQYKHYFPDLRRFLMLSDLNGNGLKDLFTYTKHAPTGIAYYRNVSDGNGIRFEKITDRMLYEGSNELISGIYLRSSDLPVITDISGNGLADILTFSPSGTTVSYYRNRADETYPDQDTTDFILEDRCWGRFAEAFDDNDIDLELTRGNYARTGKKHQGGTITALDMFGHGHYDLLIGDAESPRIKLLLNGKNTMFSEPYEVDSMIEVRPMFPENNPVNVPFMPGTYIVDVTADGRKELITAPNELSETLTTNQVWMYRDQGSNERNFAFERNNFLQQTMLDLGKNSVPAFFDYNGNGTYDLLIATDAAVDGTTSATSHRLVLYINEGTNAQPDFYPADDDYLGFSERSETSLHPAFGDLTGNGLADLLIGQSHGDLLYFRNTAEAGEPARFEEADGRMLTDEPVPEYAAPALADIDSNGQADLFLGTQSGRIQFYRSTGTDNPYFEQKTDEWGQIRTNDWFYEYTYDENNNPVDSERVYINQGFAAPLVADVTGDGKLNAVTGSLSRGLLVYEVLSNPEDTFPESPPLFYNPGTGEKEYVRKARNTKPALMQAEDGTLLLLVGNRRGGLLGFSTEKQEAPSSLSQASRSERPVNIYPNPATDHLTIDTDSEIRQIKLWDATGRLLKHHENPSKNVINTSHLPPGIYIIHVKTEHFGLSSRRISVE